MKNSENELLAADLRELADLLIKYGYEGQADVAEKILVSLRTSDPDYKLLTSVSMWGGSGAVWDVYLSSQSKFSKDARNDEIAFRKTIIRIADAWID